MTTKFITIKDFRQNIAQYAITARQGKERFVVMNRTTPLFELKPFAIDTDLSALIEDIVAAKKDIANGKLYSHAQVLAELQ